MFKGNSTVIPLVWTNAYNGDVITVSVSALWYKIHRTSMQGSRVIPLLKL